MTYLEESILKLLDDDVRLNNSKYINDMFQQWDIQYIARYFSQLVGVTCTEIDHHLPDEYTEDKAAFYIFQFENATEITYLKISATMESYVDLADITYKIVKPTPKTIFVYE